MEFKVGDKIEILDPQHIAGFPVTKQTEFEVLDIVENTVFNDHILIDTGGSALFGIVMSEFRYIKKIEEGRLGFSTTAIAGREEHMPVLPETFTAPRDGIFKIPADMIKLKAGDTLKQKTSALDIQISGSHYNKMVIQPVEFITQNNIGYIEGNVIKYICRHADKNGKEDLEKIKHYIDLLIEAKYP